MVEGGLLAAARLHSGGRIGNSGSGGPFFEWLAAPYRSGLFLHWIVCFAAPLDRAWFAAFLYFLSGFRDFLFLPLHRKTQSVLLDHPVEQCSCVAAAASAVSAFCFDLP